VYVLVLVLVLVLVSLRVAKNGAKC